MLKHAPLCLGVITIACTSLAFGGSLTPPSGAIAPTPGPEPRTPISATTTPGDADSVYRIDAPGSYYVTGDVTGVNAKAGIEINSSNVTIDLMGFQLIGVPGSLAGVRMSALNATNITIRNGSVRSWGGSGIDFLTNNATTVRVESVQALNNSGTGIALASSATVEGCQAIGNNGDGITGGDSCVIADSLAQSNSVIGINVAGRCVISGCVASQNTSHGINTSVGAQISHCTCSTNSGGGINTGAGARVSECAAYDNTGDGIKGTSFSVSGCTSSFNDGDGIETSANSLITGNSCISNGGTTGAGIRLTNADTLVEGNNCVDNHYGIYVDASGNVVIRNTCSGNAIHFYLVSDNAVGPIVQATVNIGTISGSTYAGSTGSTDPNANYSY